MDKKVSITTCVSYDKCYEQIKQSIDLLGGMEHFIEKGDNVVIKPNYVSKKNPDEAVTTHPEFLHAVIRLVEEAGGNVLIAESPGGAYNTSVLKGIYSICGANDAILETNAKLNFDTSFKEVSLPNGETIKSTTIITPILKADKIINLPKLKTHAMTAYTGAVKNLFGTIPGTHKAELHFRLDDRDAFCSMLVDLHETVNPTLSIMDGVWGMEGDGPTAGINRNMGVIIASANSHALDLVGTHIMDFKPLEVSTVKNAIARNLVPKSVDELEILGDDLEKHIMHDIIKPASHFNLLKLLSLPPNLNKKITALLAAKPKLNKDLCIGCGECQRCCPVKAIHMKDGKPIINESSCIKCFCCQELCPKKAMIIHRSFFNKLMLKFLK